MLQGNYVVSQIRQLTNNGKLQIKYKNYQKNNFSQYKNNINRYNWKEFNNSNQIFIKNENNFSKYNTKKLVFYCYSISTNLLKEASAKLGFSPVITSNIEEATVIIGLKKHLKQNLRLKKLAEKSNKFVYSINSVSIFQLTKLLKNVL